MAYVLGIDSSTTATKAILVDERGAVVGVGASEYPFETPHPLWSEQDPDLWWTATCRAIGQVLADTRGRLGAGGVEAAVEKRQLDVAERHPVTMREAALGMGASATQVVFHHVIPQALPGMLTGTIIGMSRALGETAPLLMIGMVAFIVDVPASFTDPATALPVQIYLWADSPERAFAERTAAAIIVLLGFLLLMNLAAVILRHRMERRT